jgi:FRG domain-containing protein
MHAVTATTRPMGIETVNSWRELDDAIAAASGPLHAHSPLVFRGLPRSDYANVSSLARLSGDYASLERHLIRNFRKYAHREAPGPTVWDWLSLAQHHGLPTRLLDWTYSPLVALHFASAALAEDEGILWAVDVGRVHELLPGSLQRALSGEGASVFTTELLAEYAGTLEALEASAGESSFLLFFEPPSLDERIVNQAAVLSAMSDPAHHVDEWLAEHPECWCAWRIPAEVKLEVRDRLDQANITERVLLPGLDGLAAWLRRYYSPRGKDVRSEGAAMATGAP